MEVGSCCLKAFEWNGTPEGRIDKLEGHDVYITGHNPGVAVLFIHDLLGWTFPNARLLADHYAREANATVYLPDFFDGWVVEFEPVLAGRFHEIDLESFHTDNARNVREPEIFNFAKALRGRHDHVGAIGFCYGGWAVFRLGAKEHNPPLVDCISVGHPTWLTKKDMDEVAVPVQMLAPEIDPVFTAEMKSYCFETVTRKGVPFEYHHFPGVEHSCFVRGDPGKSGEREAMARAKSAVVSWLNTFLH
ncbi:dienelactone hydrolase [Colletotrichum navitas]|uniref:Dienelactone hydrolase n=1 Tax=Colletotrichum navitas TaxID=681940 RepID=A0AAD8V737_9PEZI|nr:dienelactone hydrolase [Colletotrichum navitas]KAK1596732.1 dienelactone hydrolase [Colletotrichum navitas]